MVPLNPDRLTYSVSVQDISRTLGSRVRDVSAALAGLDTDIVSARARDIAGDSWTPQVLLIDATGVDPADLDALHAQVSALTEAGRVATAVVMTGGPPPAAPVAQAVLTADGKLSVPAILGAEPVAAAALTGSNLDGLLALFANADGGDVPIPPSVLDEPWATHMDDSGALIPPVVMDEPIQVWAATQHTTADAAGPEMSPPVVREVSAADLTRLRSVLADDPTLDSDLTEWHSEVDAAAADRPPRSGADHRGGGNPQPAHLVHPGRGVPGGAPRRRDPGEIHRRSVAGAGPTGTGPRDRHLHPERDRVQGPPVDGHPPGHGCAVRADGHGQVLPAQRPTAGQRAAAAAAETRRRQGRRRGSHRDRRLHDRAENGPRPGPAGGVGNRVGMAGQRRPPGRPERPGHGCRRGPPGRAGRVDRRRPGPGTCLLYTSDAADA